MPSKSSTTWRYPGLLQLLDDRPELLLKVTQLQLAQVGRRREDQCVAFDLHSEDAFARGHIRRLSCVRADDIEESAVAPPAATTPTYPRPTCDGESRIQFGRLALETSSFAASTQKNGLGDGANRRGTRVTGLQVGVGLLARLEQRETGHPLDELLDPLFTLPSHAMPIVGLAPSDASGRYVQ